MSERVNFVRGRGNSQVRNYTSTPGAPMVRGSPRRTSPSPERTPPVRMLPPVLAIGLVPALMALPTVTPPQALLMMNGDAIEKASAKFAERLEAESGGDLRAAVDIAYQIAIARPPSASELDTARRYLQDDPARLKGLAWLLFNLDEFIYLR